MQRLICTLCQLVKSNTLTLRTKLKIKCRDLSVCSANQWKATHQTWGCNSRTIEGDHWGWLIKTLSILYIEKASKDKEEVYEGGWSGVPTPSTTAIKNLFFIMWSFLYKLKVWLVTSWRQTAMSMMFNPRRETMKEIVEPDIDPMKEVLHLGQDLLLLTLNKLCCQIWAKEGDHEGSRSVRSASQ